MGTGVSRESDISRESRSNVWGESHVRYRLRFIPAWGMLQQVGFVARTAVQTIAAVPPGGCRDQRGASLRFVGCISVLLVELL